MSSNGIDAVIAPLLAHLRIQKIHRGLPSNFNLAADVDTVQFEEPLDNQDYLVLASELERRPNVRLRVYGHSSFTDVDFLEHFPNVRKLSIDLWSLDDLSGFQAVRALDEFTFLGTQTKSHSLDFLKRFPTLRKLYLEGHKKDIEVIASLSRIEHLTLRSITLPSFDLLTSLPALSGLEIKLGGSKNLDAIQALQALRYLELWLVKGLSDLSVIAEIKTLERLSLQALRNVRSLPSFRKLQDLRAISLETMKGLTDLAPIAEAPALEWLSLLDMPSISVEAVQCLVGHPSLQFFRAGLGSMKRNADAEALLGLRHPTGEYWTALS